MSAGGGNGTANLGDAPPLGEEVHLPGPTVIPVVNAFGTALALVGLLFHWTILVTGIVIVVWSTLRWIADTRRDIAQLPLEHH